MTTRLTPLALSVVTLVAWGLVLGVFSGRPELIVAVAPLLLGLLRRARANPVRDWRISHSLSVDRAVEGERVVVTVIVNAGQPSSPSRCHRRSGWWRAPTAPSSPWSGGRKFSGGTRSSAGAAVG